MDSSAWVKRTKIDPNVYHKNKVILGYYSPERTQEISDKDTFVAKTIEDLLEQTLYLFVASKKGYCFEFYPGKPNSSSEYINHKILP